MFGDKNKNGNPPALYGLEHPEDESSILELPEIPAEHAQDEKTVLALDCCRINSLLGTVPVEFN